jgi:hypothetical protein
MNPELPIVRNGIRVVIYDRFVSPTGVNFAPVKRLTAFVHKRMLGFTSAFLYSEAGPTLAKTAAFRSVPPRKLG